MTADSGSVPTPEFSRVFPVDSGLGTGDAGCRFEIAASAEERAALARRFGLEKLDRLEAEGLIEVFGRGRRARLTARFSADVGQRCVVTLVPLASRLEEEFTVEYERGAGGAAAAELEVRPDEPDPPEPLADAGINVGEAVAEHLGLAIDPWPRAPGAELAAGEGTAGEEDESPFAALRRLKGR